jgi:hypothetical protein
MFDVLLNFLLPLTHLFLSSPYYYFVFATLYTPVVNPFSVLDIATNLSHLPPINFVCSVIVEQKFLI